MEFGENLNNKDETLLIKWRVQKYSIDNIMHLCYCHAYDYIFDIIKTDLYTLFMFAYYLLSNLKCLL